MRNLLIALMVVAGMLVACSAPVQQQAPPQEVPQELPPPPAPPVQEQAPAEDEGVQEVDSGLDEFFGPRNETAVVSLDDIDCDAQERSLRFRFRNTGEKTWQLDQEVPFPAPTDLGSVRITLNGYEVNGKRAVLSQGETMFRTEGSFSDQCGGVSELAAGDEVVCMVQPVPLKTSTGYGYGANELRINGPDADGVVRFTCG